MSPQNIVVSLSGTAKIIDFGVAKIRGRTQSTRIGALKGKFAYMSPEQIRGEPLDGRADLYALGIVLYEIATLRRPYAGLDGLRLMDAILAGKFTAPRTARRDLSPAFATFLARAIATNVTDRFQTPPDMAAALLTALGKKALDPIASTRLVETVLRPAVAAWVAKNAPAPVGPDTGDKSPDSQVSIPFGINPFDALPVRADIDGDEAQSDATHLGDSLDPREPEEE